MTLIRHVPLAVCRRPCATGTASVRFTLLWAVQHWPSQWHSL
jgi:hypothetical protein